MEAISKGEYVCENRSYRVYHVGSAEEAQMANMNKTKKAAMCCRQHTQCQSLGTGCALMQQSTVHISIDNVRHILQCLGNQHLL